MNFFKEKILMTISIGFLGTDLVKKLILKFIELLENQNGIKAINDFMQIQSGHYEANKFENSEIYHWNGFIPLINLKKQLYSFLKWYLNYFIKI